MLVDKPPLQLLHKAGEVIMEREAHPLPGSAASRRQGDGLV